MANAKIAILLDKKILKTLDQLVEKKMFPNRSGAISQALEEKIARMTHGRLARECAKLDPEAEQAMAGEGLRFEQS